MPKIKYFFILACAFASSIMAQDHTMFIPRLISTNQIFELANTNYLFHENREPSRELIAFKPFYQRTQSPEQAARFFLPRGKKCISLREDDAGDVNPLWLNLISAPGTSYSSHLSLCPQRTAAGIVITWYKALSHYCDNLWIGINTALVHAQHKTHLKEFNRINQGTLPGFANACEAFNNIAWTAGKISTKPLQKTGLDDIQLKIGYDWLELVDTRISPYLLATIPTGTRPKAYYVFEPLVGSKHGSFGFGFNADYSHRESINLMFDAKYSYFFKSNERRSFDLKNGDWSRYLQVVTQAEPLYSLPGINACTKSVSVTPGTTFQLWAALHYCCNQWQLEAGYNFWYRAQEKIKLNSCNVTLPCSATAIGILDMAQLCSGQATTAHTAKISQGIVPPNLVVSDTQFTPTTARDLSISSALNPHAFSNTLYGACGYQLSCVSLTIALNASYELTKSCGTLPNYAIWGTLNYAF